MALLWKGMRKLYFFVFGHIIAFFRYDKQYLKGKWFQGRMHGLAATGWEWVVHDARNCHKLHVNKDIPWPISFRQTVVRPENISFHPDDLNNFQAFGCYFQAIGKIEIGRGTYIAPNVGIITANHSVENLDSHDQAEPVILGEKCWIGMNSVILPGVELGAHTVVGAGSVVTKSFPQGDCVIAGNPAKIIRKLDAQEDTKK